MERTTRSRFVASEALVCKEKTELLRTTGTVERWRWLSTPDGELPRGEVDRDHDRQLMGQRGTGSGNAHLTRLGSAALVQRLSHFATTRSDERPDGRS